MKTRYITALAVATLIAGGNAALAHGTGHGQGGQASPQGMMGQGGQMGPQGMMGRSGMDSGGMMQMHQQMMGMHKGMMQGGGMMGGGMGSMGSMGGIGGMMEALDADGDGTVTPDEAHEGLQALVAEYDADGDETLSIAEFETLHSALIREAMVDRFQFLDDDGDGQVTMGEIVKPADMMARMQSMRESMMQGGGMGPGNGMGQQGASGQGMMGNN